MQIEFELTAELDPAVLEMLWRDLEPRGPPNFFLSWQWIGAWLREAKLRPWVLIGRRKSQVVVLAALVASNRVGALAVSSRLGVGPIGMAGVRLHTTGVAELDVITIEYNGFLVDAALGQPGEDAALDFLMNEARIDGRACDEIDLRNVSRRYATYAGQRGLMHRMVGRKPSYRIDLDSIRVSGRSYLDQLSANTRQQIRRSMRLYEAIGPLALRRATDLVEAMAFLEGLKALHQPYWQSRGEPGAFAYPFLETLMQRLIVDGLESGSVELVRVSRGEVAIGYLYNFVHRGQVYCYQCGFLFEDDAKLKPGLVTHALCIEDHLRAGNGIYDFMGGDARYKSSLGQPGPDLHYVVLQRPTMSVRAENGLRWLRNRLRSIRRDGTADAKVPE